MRILLQHNHADNEISGIKRYLDELQDELVRQQHEVRLVSSKAASWSELEAAVQWADVIHLNSNHLRLAIRTRQLRKRLVVKYHFPFWARFVYGPFHSCSLGSHILKDMALRTQQAQPLSPARIRDLFNGYGRIFGRLLVAGLAHVRLAPSKFIAESADLPGGVHVNHYPMRPELDRQAIQALARQRELLFVGRIDQYKGLEVLLEALALPSESIEPIVLHVAGVGTCLSESRQKAVHLGISKRVVFHGMLDRPGVTALMRRVSAVVVPSKWNDPSPLVVLEAAANGCVCIVSDRGGLPEIVGPSGFIFKTENREELAKCINQLFTEDSAVSRGLEARDFLIREFAPKAVTERFIELAK